MTVTAVHTDPQRLTLTIEAEFAASIERMWQLWAEPRQLERWWGPPTYPATVTTHDLIPGRRIEYHMTGPEGDQSRGYWEVTPRRGRSRPGCWTSCRSIRSRCCSAVAVGCSTSCRRASSWRSFG